MKILHVIDSLGRGGAEQLLVMLLPELQRQGVAVCLAVRGGSMDLAPAIEAAGITVTRLSRRHRWNLVGSAKEIARLASREEVNVIHAHLYFPAVATALTRILRLSQARTCVTFHNLAYGGANQATLRLAFRRRLAAFFYTRGMNRCLAVSSAVAEHYQHFLGLQKVGILPNPVDLSKLRRLITMDKPSQSIGTECRIVLPGRIVREKGHTDLLAALALLIKDNSAPHLVIAGDGPLRNEVAAQVKALGLDEVVTFTGELDHEALMRLVSKSDIVAIPSRYEGFGLTALEAMALGRAVIATRAGGLPETLGDAGLLVPRADPAALAEAISKLTSDPALRAKLGAAAVQRAEGFDLPTITGRLIEIYKSLIPSSPPSFTTKV